MRKLYTLCGAHAGRPFSPHAWKAVMALNHKGLHFEEFPTSFTKIKSVEGGATSIVPFLVDGERSVGDSFAIATYLDEAYPDRPSLFGGESGKAAARLIEGYVQTALHPAITRIIVKDIHDILAPEDQAYFRASREQRLGRTLEEVEAESWAELESFAARLEPVRHMLKYQPFVGGNAPLFGDYILFGAFQWARIASPKILLAGDDPVRAWFERCLDLHGGVGRAVAAAG